jgi:hypothetical protein
MKLFSQVGDINIEFVRILPDGITSPHIIYEICTRHWCTTIFDQIFQDIKLLDREVDLDSCFSNRSVLQCDRYIIIDKFIAGRRSAIQCLDTSHQLRQIKRLNQIVIRPTLKPSQLIINLSSRSQHDHRYIRSLTNASAQIHTTKLGQHPIQYHHIITMSLTPLSSLLAISGYIYLDVFELEIFGNVGCDLDIVFNEEDTHYRRLKRLKRTQRLKRLKNKQPSPVFG